MNRDNIKAIFGSAPLFEPGDHVFSEYSLKDRNGGVVHCKEYGMVSALTFCEEINDYEGWTYDIQIYKIVSIIGKEKTIELYPNLSYLQAPEFNLERCYEKIDKEKIVKAILLSKREGGVTISDQQVNPTESLVTGQP